VFYASPRLCLLAFGTLSPIEAVLDRLTTSKQNCIACSSVPQFVYRLLATCADPLAGSLRLPVILSFVL
jgi:hypothetical protein